MSLDQYIFRPAHRRVYFTRRLIDSPPAPERKTVSIIQPPAMFTNNWTREHYIIVHVGATLVFGQRVQSADDIGGRIVRKAQTTGPSNIIQVERTNWISNTFN